MVTDLSHLPDDVEALKQALRLSLTQAETAEQRRIDAEQKLLDSAAELAVARAKASEDLALIAAQKLRIAKLERQIYGARKERAASLIDQLELELEESDANATEDEIAAEMAVALSTRVEGFVRKRPEHRTTFPDHLPRERVVVDPPTACQCCGGGRLRKLGEKVTRTLESIPRQWKVIETVRETFTCRDCERISEPPAPFHVIPRGWAGPSLLAMILHEKFASHQPLNRLSVRFAAEGVPLSLSTLADAVGPCCVALDPLLKALERHVFSASRLFGDDTTVPVLAKGKTQTGRIWVYVSDDRPFGGRDPPAVVFYYSRDRRGEHPRSHLSKWSGLFQADAFGGYDALYDPGRKPGPIRHAACWSHGRRPFFEYADIEGAARRKAQGQAQTPISPIALEAVRRIDTLFEIEREISGHAPELRHKIRQHRSRPIVEELKAYFEETRKTLSPKHDLAKAMTYMLKRWHAFCLFLEDGRVCLSNNAAERALRGVAQARNSWMFAGSDRGGERAAAIYSLIMTCRLNDVDPHARLADILARLAGHPAHRIDELLPWRWKELRTLA